MDKIKQLKELYDEGLMSKEEYEERRNQVINEMTATEYGAGNTNAGGSADERTTVLQDDNDDRWGADAQGAAKVADPLPVILPGQRTDMPLLKEKQSELEKVIFRAVVGNEIEVLRDLHNKGADFNIHEPNAGNTPLHIACSVGMRHMAQFLVERGALVNIKNNERKSPLHLLVERRWADLAKWLVYQGADVTSKDKYGKTALDYAHPWLQGELKEIVAQRIRAEAVANGHVLVAATNDYGKQPQILNIKAGTGMTSEEELAQAARRRGEEKKFQDLANVYLRNMRCKEVSYLNTDTVQDVINKAAEAFGMPEVKSHLQLFVRTGKKDAKGVLEADDPLDPQANLTRVRDNDWPERDSYKLILQPLQGAPYNMGMRYREIMYGADADLSTRDQNFVKDPTPKKNTDEGIFGDIKKKFGKDGDKKGDAKKADTKKDDKGKKK